MKTLAFIWPPCFEPTETEIDQPRVKLGFCNVELIKLRNGGYVLLLGFKHEFD